MSATATTEQLGYRFVGSQTNKVGRPRLQSWVFPFPAFAQIEVNEQVTFPSWGAALIGILPGITNQYDIYDLNTAGTMGFSGIGLIDIKSGAESYDELITRVQGLGASDESFTSATILEGLYDLAIEGNDDPSIGSRRAGELPEFVLDRLSMLAQLPADWDSYGAPPINADTTKRAASTLSEILGTGEVEVPLPFIAPAGDGTIVMEWKTDAGKELILDVPPDDGPLTFLLVEPTESGKELELEETIGERWPLAQVIRRLLTN